MTICIKERIFMSDTIYSLSSGQGRAGVAVIRISGSLADQALMMLCGRLPQYRVATLMMIFDPMKGHRLDQGLILRFAEGHSFTGDASCELQIHGGRAVVQAVLKALSEMTGFRLSEPGEFTRRAMENGRLDLTQVEALADLIDADTEAQRKQALNSLEGALGREVMSWRKLIRDIKSLIAAEIDFSDEGDVADDFGIEIDSLLKQLNHQLNHALKTADSGRIIAEGFRVALVGPPNAGKSSLLNALAGSDVAIVTEYAGTTRDILEVRLDFEGYSVILIDTAGIREAIDPVEKIGVSRARFAASRAHLILILEDDSEVEFVIPKEMLGVESIRIRSKSDLKSSSRADDVLYLSAFSGEGLAELRSAVARVIRQSTVQEEAVLVSRERQRLMIERAIHHCVNAQKSLLLGIEFVDESVRAIDQSLAELLGEVDIEEVLGDIFSRFCVGK
jgi:tRNA modification GTPase